MRIVKQNDVWCILDDEDRAVYSLPRHLRLVSREDLKPLVEEAVLHGRPRIDTIMALETRLPRRDGPRVSNL